jgi:hypothetical protein
MINIKMNKDFKKLFSINANSLSFYPVKIYNNMLDDKFLILSEFNKQSGIYLLHNFVNGKQYVGSTIDFKQSPRVGFTP